MTLFRNEFEISNFILFGIGYQLQNKSKLTTTH